MQKTDNIKIIKLINGDDIVTVCTTGETTKDDYLLRLDKALQIKYVLKLPYRVFRDYINMIRWTNYTSDKIVASPKDKILTITGKMSNSYSELVTKYDKLDKLKRDDKLSKKSLHSEENKKINEIFKELDDEEEDERTIH